MSKKRQTKAPSKLFEFQTGSRSLPTINRRRLYSLLGKRRHDLICESILEILLYFQDNNFMSLNAEALNRINDIASVILAVISDPTFIVPSEKAAALVGRAHLFANLVALSDYGVTDQVLRHVMRQENNLYKILFLYTVKNRLTLDSSKFFDMHPQLASLWYYTYPLATIGCVTPYYQVNMRRHFENPDSRYSPADHRVSLPYFYCTYFAGESRSDRPVKELINKSCQEQLQQINIRIKNVPARDSIAVVTSKWFENSAVYKSCYPLLDRLRPRYRMTLLHTGPFAVPELAKNYFDVVHKIQFQETPQRTYELTTSSILENDFQLAYFPDIGMTDESIWLSNLRLAPIQVTGYGHPVSTFGSEMDYFVVGTETEVLDDLSKNYSETPIVLPGLGCAPVWPTYKPKYPEKKTDKIVANCVWGPDKYNHAAISMLQEIAGLAPPIEYAIFSSRGVHRYNAFLPFEREIKQRVGKFATLHSRMEYMEYMEEAEFGDFTINSWPFGGYNTVVESLYLGKPVVTLEGDRFYNLAASALLRKVGLENLIAKTASEFIDLCVKMANDPAYLVEQKAKLTAIDLYKVLFDTDEPLYFERMIEYIIDNHASLAGDKNPLVAKCLVPGVRA